MWLLSTNRAELKFFVSPEDVPAPGYAILSHVWGKKEQTFQDTERLRAKCARWWWRNPRDLATPKIREFCILAEKHGFRWVWIDTCCIDKSSSAELSEAINSMFEYYARAAVCYVYLADVFTTAVHDYDLINSSGTFCGSRWHRRGWTLQELLAPDIVVFLNSSWQALGTKAQLADILEEVTKVPADVLMLRAELSDISIATRMSWASDRETTRPEDEAYCLMGIFGINMPTLYGEGRAAFVRLQEEIMKQSTDASLFVWGPGCYAPPESAVFRFRHDSHGPESDLLAPAPSAFRGWSNVRFVPDQRPATVTPGLPTFTPTPHGILARVPVIKGACGVVAALLFCIDMSLGGHMVLILTECVDMSSPLGPLYDIGGTRELRNRPRRLLLIGDFSSDAFESGELCIEWQDIYLAHRPPSRAANPQTRLMNHALFPSFRIPHQFISYRDTETTLSISSASSGLMVAFLLERPGALNDRFLVLRLGHCATSATGQGPSMSSGVPWATLSYCSSVYSNTSSDHVCSRDHILEWPHWQLYSEALDVHFTKVFSFRLSKRRVFKSRPRFHTANYVALSFAPSPCDPDLLNTSLLLSGSRSHVGRGDGAIVELVLDHHLPLADTPQIEDGGVVSAPASAK